MSTISRRNLLKLTGAGAAVGAISLSSLTHAQTNGKTTPTGSTTLPYPSQSIAKLKALVVNQPLSFFYPDNDSPCVLIKMGKSVMGGVGPDQDVVAFSILCTHMGCPVSYDQAEESFKCLCHYSMFDPDKGGQMINGQATESLPQIMLTYNHIDDSIEAVAIDGLIYGRQANII